MWMADGLVFLEERDFLILGRALARFMMTFLFVLKIFHLRKLNACAHHIVILSDHHAGSTQRSKSI